MGDLILLYWCNSIDLKVTFAGHLDWVLMQKKQKWHSWSGTRLGQPWATLPMAVLGSHLHPPSPDKAGHSKPCLPWTPPWVRLSTPLPPLKPNQALTWLEKPTNSSLNHHHHVQPQWWPMVCKQDRARPQMHNETWRTSLALSLKCMAFLFCPVPMLMLLSLSCGTNNVFTEKATQGADVEL